jgi:hypothetical protein
MDSTIPTHLTDGRWTMQWAWYGGGGGYLGDYYTCVNFQVAGGVAVTARVQPTFTGGDVSNPGSNVCEHWNTDRLHYCWREPCSDYCDDATSPVGHCGWPAVNGAPHIESFVPATSGFVPPPEPATTGSFPDDDVPEISVKVTVALQMGPDAVDITTFTYEVSSILGLPTRALREILVDLDISTSTETIVTFIIVNIVKNDGTRVDPVAAATLLRQLAESNASQLSQSLMLRGLRVVDSEELASSEDFFKTTTFIIVAAIGAGVVFLAIVIIVVAVVMKKKH